MISFVPEELERFWWFSRERYEMHLRRQAGESWPWTTDPYLRERHFCNVFRADDRTSKAVAQLVQLLGPYRSALVGRLINRPDTLDLISAGMPVRQAVGCRGLNTNAYRLNTPLGLNNAEGVFLLIEEASLLEDEVLAATDTQRALTTLGKVRCLGGFVGYQIVLDLIEFKAFGPGFIDDWCWAGVGAQRGAFTLLGRRAETVVPGSEEHWQKRRRGSLEILVVPTQQVIRDLLAQSRDPANWPWQDRPWTIHEAEGQLCEYDKYVRCVEGTMGGRRYRPKLEAQGLKHPQSSKGN